VKSRMLQIAVVAAVAMGATSLAAPAGAVSQSFTVQVDGAPPTGEPWAFLRFFPSTSLSVHQGDVVDFAFSATDTPHTATLTPDADPEQWRTTNQGASGQYGVEVPDSQFGGDDNSVVLNPLVGAPSDPTCGTSTNPCSFDASKVVTSGVQFPNPSQQPSFFVTVSAPVGSYSFLCLLHPGMEVSLTVAANSTSVPTPQQVSASAAKQLKHATKVDGTAADAMAQTISTTHHAGGTIVKLNAGGFSNNVSANEYPDAPVVVSVGDKIKFAGMPEIHTVTFPAATAADPNYALLQSFCEQPGADAPAQSPADCSDPTKFETVFNPLAVGPTASLNLVKPKTVVNSGLLVPGVNGVFIAKKPGRYTFVCLVHGPEMAGVIKIKA
jgi:plastocyanin